MKISKLIGHFLQRGLTKTSFDNVSRYKSVDLPPAISQNQIEGAKLFGSRSDSFSLFKMGSTMLEIGVLAGDYSFEFASKVSPISIDLVDTFCSRDWFHSEEPRFMPDTHLSYISQKFAKFQNVTTHKGLSDDVMRNLISQNKKFDYIYLDADHSRNQVEKDLENAIHLINPGGIIGLNDYIMWDYFQDEEYGVVQALNYFLAENPSWKVVGHALNHHLFSDIFIQQKG